MYIYCSDLYTLVVNIMNILLRATSTAFLYLFLTVAGNLLLQLCTALPGLSVLGAVHYLLHSLHPFTIANEVVHHLSSTVIRLHDNEHHKT